MQMREPNGKFAKKGSPTAAKAAGTRGGLPRKNKVVKPVSTTGLINRFALVVDASGSMQHLIPAARDAFNKNIDAIKAVVPGQQNYLTVVEFGVLAPNQIRIDYANRSADLATKLGSEYYARGGTPLRDAVGTAVESLSLNQDTPETSYVVITVTDGEENESSRYNHARLTSLIREKQATGRWSFIFLVPPGTGKYMANGYGVPQGNVREWEATTVGMAKAEAATSGGIGEFYTTRSTGATMTTNFYAKEG